MKDLFFASQEPFAKTETAKFFVVPMQRELPAFQSALFLEVPTNRRVSVSMPLTAIAKAIQDCQQIEAQRIQQWRMDDSKSNCFYKRPVYKATVPPY